VETRREKREASSGVLALKKGVDGQQEPRGSPYGQRGALGAESEGLELAEGLASLCHVFVASQGSSLEGTLFFCRGNSPGIGLRASM